jgi:hypothetical protein
MKQDLKQSMAGFTNRHFTRAKIFVLGLKSINLRFNNYQRLDGLFSNIVACDLSLRLNKIV